MPTVTRDEDDEARERATVVFDMGAPTVDLDKALALAGELEDDEIARKLALGK